MKNQNVSEFESGWIELVDTEEGHFYRVRGYDKLFPSVTTVMGQIRKPAIEKWKERTPNSREISERASRIGTEAHQAIEGFIKKDFEMLAANLSKDSNVPFQSFVRWSDETRFRIVESEILLWSSLGFAGTCDIVGYLHNELYIVDIKTSKRIYDDYAMQVAGYKSMYEERTGDKVCGCGVLRLDKSRKFYEFKEYTERDLTKALRMFLLLKEYWDLSHGWRGFK